MREKRRNMKIRRKKWINVRKERGKGGKGTKIIINKEGMRKKGNRKIGRE